MATVRKILEHVLPYSLKYTLHEDIKGTHNLLLNEV